jgi:uncharacterized protein with PIN domain
VFDSLGAAFAALQLEVQVITEYKIFPEVQLCPKCHVEMHVSDVIPTMHTTGLDQDELLYRCPECGTEVTEILHRERVE